MESPGWLRFPVGKEHLLLGAAGYSTGEGLCPPGWEGAARSRSHRGPCAGLAGVAPPPCARGCHQPAGDGSRGCPQSSQAATHGRDTERESEMVPTPKCGTAALHLLLQPWACTRSVGSECALGDAAGIAPSALGAALVSPHLSWDSDTVVMAG